MQRTLSVIFLIGTLLVPNAYGIKCFKCDVVAPPMYTNETRRLCSEFDYSERYIVDCPNSTFCTKKVYSVNITKTINGTIRDCAQQTNVIQNYENGRWQKRVQIEEPYREGCADNDDKGQRLSKTTHCYCKDQLCNHGAIAYSTIALPIVATTLLIQSLSHHQFT